ncbi:MAG TPA: phosphatidate cytidylyltransferase [Anaerolineaceae bacterium]
MLRQRLIVANILIPVVVTLIAIGGWAYNLLILVFLGIGAFEFWRLFRTGGFSPSLALLLAGTLGLGLQRTLAGFSGSDLSISLLFLVAMSWQVIQYQRGISTAALDLMITLGGVLYLGWVGGYLISLRSLPDGLWWVMLILPVIWLADTGAYIFGRAWGKHKLCPRVSPNKSWEGYFGGVLFGALSGLAFGFLWGLRAPVITPLKGLLFGVVLSALVPLGDLGESMLKRTFGVKDTGRLFWAHGGVLDRIDSWMFGVVIGYYLVMLFG